MARFGANLRSRSVALRNASMALSQSWFLEASAPSRASLFASLLPCACLASLLPCAWAACETQTARATITLRAEYFFMILWWTLISLDNSKLILLTVGRKHSLRLFCRRHLFDVDLALGLRWRGFNWSRFIDTGDAQG